ncbi:MAG TPA: hypothetical protein VKO18_00925 [Terriglobia bacterium]|nr:hypothetical protein [Terriglobia bacterium]
MPIEILFILVLHSIAAAVSLIRARRDGLGFLESLRWGGIGFITGLLALITRARTDRRHYHYMLMAQDALLNLGLEVIALYGIPHILG